MTASTTALITGANRGLGQMLAEGLAADGWNVALLGRQATSLQQLADRLQTRGVRTAVVLADVRDWAQVQAAVHQAERELGGIDLLVNNAGIIDPTEVPIWEADPASWWEVVETDLRGPFHCLRAVVPGMLARGGGRVVDLNSAAGAMDRAVYSAYCAAKAGLFRLTGSLHLAGSARGLRGFELSPGHLRTDMTASMPMHAQRTEWVPIEAVLALLLAIGRGDLDAWSGGFLRAGVDTPESLIRAATDGAVASGGVPGSMPRRLGVFSYGDDDPLISG